MNKASLTILIFLLPIFALGQKQPQYAKGNPALKELLKKEVSFPELSLNTMDCGFSTVVMQLSNTGKVDSIYLKQKLGPKFDSIALAAVKKFEGFSPYTNKKGETKKAVVVQPIGYLFNDRVCPTWTKLEDDTNYVVVDSVFYLPEFSIQRDSRALANAVYRETGLKLVDLGKYKEAIPYFTEGMTFEPENDFYPYNLGICYYHIREINEACKYLKQAKKMGNKIAKSVYKDKCDF